MKAGEDSGWRRPRRRGVSPIIATILLVAITVVLAAVLYVLISGLAKAPGRAPVGLDLAWGPAEKITGTASTAGCASGHICYSLEIASSSPGLTGAAMTFSARSSSGGAVPLTHGASVNDAITLVNSGAVATTAAWAGAGACSGAACTSPLESGMTIVIDSGGATDALAGDTIVAIGTGSYSGEVSSGSLN